MGMAGLLQAFGKCCCQTLATPSRLLLPQFVHELGHLGGPRLFLAVDRRRGRRRRLSEHGRGDARGARAWPRGGAGGGGGGCFANLLSVDILAVDVIVLAEHGLHRRIGRLAGWRLAGARPPPPLPLLPPPTLPWLIVSPLTKRLVPLGSSKSLIHCACSAASCSSSFLRFASRASLCFWKGVFFVPPSEKVASLSEVILRTAPGLMVLGVSPKGKDMPENRGVGGRAVDLVLGVGSGASAGVGVG